MITEIILLTAAGAGVGALMGMRTSCPDGGCPLTANPKRGAIWGGILGLAVALSATAGFDPEQSSSVSAPAVALGGPWREVATAEEFQSEVLDQPGVTVAFFHAKWCGSCRRFTPILNGVVKDTADNVHYVSIDADAAEALFEKYEVWSMPTTLFFKDGKQLGRLVGVVPEEDVRKAIVQAATPSGGKDETTEVSFNVQ